MLNFSSATSFALIGLLTLLFSLFFILRLSDYFFHFISRKFYIPQRLKVKPDLSLLADYPDAPLILTKTSWKEAFLLIGTIPHLHVFILKKSRLAFPWLESLFYSLHRTSSNEKLPDLIEKQKRRVRKDEHICIMGDNLLAHSRYPHPTLLKTFFTIGAADVLHVHFKWDHNKKHATLHLTKEPLR